MKLSLLEAKLGYSFKNQSLLEQALTHPSYDLSTKGIQERKIYQRMEFLGDAVVGLVMADFIYKAYPEAPEGQLALMHANAVKSDSMVKIANGLGLSEHMLTSKSEDMHIASNMENSLESMIGSLYIDGSYSEAQSIVMKLWREYLFSDALYNPVDKSIKSQLQEYAQSKGWGLPKYKLLSSSGPSHSPIFVIEVTASEHFISAEGSSKKDAENSAAKALLDLLLSS